MFPVLSSHVRPKQIEGLGFVRKGTHQTAPGPLEAFHIYAAVDIAVAVVDTNCVDYFFSLLPGHGSPSLSR